MYYSKHRVLRISIIIPEEACIALIKPPGAAEYTLKKIFDFLKTSVSFATIVPSPK